MKIGQRNSSIELLRIIAMLLIVMSHFSVHTTLDINENALFFNNIIINTTKIGNLGNNIFILIASYFLYNSNMKLSKILKILFQTLFYSISIFIISIMLNDQLTIKNALSAFFPLTFSTYWFATTYVMFYLISPFLNLILKLLNKEMHRIMLILGIIIWVLLKTCTNQDLGYSNLIWFIYLFFVAAYIKEYKPLFSLNTKIHMAIGYGSLLLIALSVISISFLSIKIDLFKNKQFIFMNMYSPFVLIASIEFFIVALKTNIKENKIINFISICTFGVYLIHDHPFTRDLLWNKIMPTQFHYDKLYFIFYELSTVIIVFIVCTLIEFIRRMTIEKLTNKLIEKIKFEF